MISRPKIDDNHRVYRGGAGEALVFLVIGCAAIPLAGWLLYAATDQDNAVKDLLTWTAIGAFAGGTFLIGVYYNRRGQKVEVSPEEIVVTVGNLVDRVAIENVVNFYQSIPRDRFDQPLLPVPGHGVKVHHEYILKCIDGRLIRVPLGVEDSWGMRNVIVQMLCSLHLSIIMNTVAEGSWHMGNNIIITPTGVWDSRNSEDGLKWDELRFDQGGEDEEPQLRLWKKGAIFTNWRAFRQEDVNLFPVVERLLTEQQLLAEKGIRPSRIGAPDRRGLLDNNSLTKDGKRTIHDCENCLLSRTAVVDQMGEVVYYIYGRGTHDKSCVICGDRRQYMTASCEGCSGSGDVTLAGGAGVMLKGCMRCRGTGYVHVDWCI